GLIFACIDSKIDPTRRSVLARFGENDDRLAGGQHGVETGGADADALLASSLLQTMKLGAIEELGEDFGNLLLDDAGAVVLDADSVSIFRDLDDVDREGGQNAGFFAGVEGVVDRF